jgi:hypothetical protein
MDMVNAKFPNAASFQAEKTVQSIVFDALLAEAGRRQTFDTTVESQSRNRDEGTRNRPDETREARREPQQVRRSGQTQTEETTSTAATAAIQEQSTTEEISEATTEINETEAVEKIAEILQVPVEFVTEWLQEAELTAQDLTDPQAVAKILLLAFEAETPAELLTNPEFPENYKAINEAIAEIIVEAKTETAVTVQATVKVNTETMNALAEDLENAEIIIEDDGEIIVAKNENSTNKRSPPSFNNSASRANSSKRRKSNGNSRGECSRSGRRNCS